ncbi:MAG: ABC transporter permease [Planctomycetaceae bacterium]
MKHFVLPGILLIEFAVFTPFCGVDFSDLQGFINSGSGFLDNLLTQSTPIVILACGMTVILMAAGIDLSVGSQVALVACVMSTFTADASFWYLAVPLGLALSIGLGLFNGVMIGRLEVPPIIATLGSLFFFRGLCQVVIGDRENAPFFDIPAYPWLGTWQGSLVLISIVFGVGGCYFHNSRWRREILMIGGNRIAARYAGIPVTRRLCEVYTLMGCLGFLAALCFTARNGSIKASSLQGLELQVIVATVLGGTRVSGGSGSLTGSLVGVFIIAVLGEGLRGFAFWAPDGFPFKISHCEYVLMGGLLVLSVWLHDRTPVALRPLSSPKSR